jgi:plasmid stabilization system protein ParE
MIAYLVIWSPLAEETYLYVLTQVLEKWTIREAEEFETKVESLIDKLRTHKYLCPSSKKQKSLRRCVISPQTSLIYQINKDTIELVAFIDNRSLHQY